MATDLPALGSLAQAVRGKQLNTARGILLFVGILTIAINGFLFARAETAVDEALGKQVEQVQRAGMVVDQEALAKIRDRAVRVTELVQGSAIALGGLFVVLGLVVKMFPVPVTITAVVLYVGAAAIYGLMAPETLLQGVIIKAIIVVALIKSISSALAYEREEKLSGQATVSSSEVPG